MPEGADLVVRIAEDADTAVRVVGDQTLNISGAADGEVVTVGPSETLVARTLAEAGIQPLDADLSAIAALATTAFGRSLLTLANAAAGLTALGAQPLDSDLTSIAALATTTYGRALLTLADRAAHMSLLSLTEADVSGLVSDLAAKVSAAIVDAKGDLIAATAADTLARLAVGANGAALLADSNATPGLLWAIVENAPIMRTGAWYGPGGTYTTGNATDGLLVSQAFNVIRRTTVDRIGTVVNTAGAGSAVRLGIYSDDGNGRPSAVLLDAGTVDTSGTGIKTITISQLLVPGRYHLAAVMQGGTPPNLFKTAGSSHEGMHELSSIDYVACPGYQHNNTVTSGALPTFVVANPANPIRVYLRAA